MLAYVPEGQALQLLVDPADTVFTHCLQVEESVFTMAVIIASM